METIAEDEKYIEKKEFQLRSLKSLKQSLGKLLGRRSVNITEYDPTYKVVYLGNVLTGWAKGDACTEKPLNTLWKNYVSNSKPDVHMKLTVTQSGLKAVTKQHGLTEYWSHRITYCCAPRDLPRIFCWVYRHEGRKLKQELRCHAVLCPKESTAKLISTQLQTRLAQALLEFKRDKISRQNARLSLANSVYENPSLPRRKILLSTGCHNYRPPLERSKSAPKLMSIEECLEEEEDTPQCERKIINRCETKQKQNYRNLTYSNRGNKLGGLHCLRYLDETNDSSADTDNNESQNHSESTESSSQRENIPKACTEVVEENPLGSYTEDPNLWPLRNCSLLESINRALDSKRKSENQSKTNSDQSHVSKSPTRFMHRNSWAGEKLCYSLPLSTINDDHEFLDSGSDPGSPVFENDIENDRVAEHAGTNRDGPVSLLQRSDSERSAQEDSLSLEESCEPQSDILLRTYYDSDTVSSFDDDSTSSLRSISSGSDTSSPRDVKSGFAKNYDFDSLWEEDSDESGFVESCHDTDDNIKDIPHHHLMKNCILRTSNSHCLKV